VVHVMAKRGKGITEEGDPEYDNIRTILDGTASRNHDRDSGQVAVRITCKEWAKGKLPTTTLLRTNALPLGYGEAALWSGDAKKAFSECDVPFTATRVDVVLVYTDIMYGRPDNHSVMYNRGFPVSMKRAPPQQGPFSSFGGKAYIRMPSLTMTSSATPDCLDASR